MFRKAGVRRPQLKGLLDDIQRLKSELSALLPQTGAGFSLVIALILMTWKEEVFNYMVRGYI